MNRPSSTRTRTAPSARQSVTIPAELAVEVERVAREKHLTMSRALVVLAQRGVEAEASGNWGTAANWNCGSSYASGCVPVNTTAVTIANGGGATLDVNGTASSLTLAQNMGALWLEGQFLNTSGALEND